MKHIKILATGGTIAGRGANAQSTTGYQAGAINIEDLLTSVPGIDSLANISSEQIANIGSQDMTEDILITLARRCEDLLQDSDVDGIVITHGTDTLEETAYFLHLTVHSSKPIVVVGAMRPATALSSDGPINLLNAVNVAAADNSHGQGVLVLMNDEIYSARDVSKINTANVAAFKAPTAGPLGFIVGGVVIYTHKSILKHTTYSPFSLSGIAKLPRVDIIYTHINEDRILIDACVAAGAKGIVYAGSGMGSIHQNAFPGLADASRQGIVVVRSSRTGSGIVAPSLPKWTEAGFLDGDSLNPQKARILLQLALTITEAHEQIQDYFHNY